jgi:hypothetical protein
MRKTFKLQSAMEYLMTYGWAILIIAVVLGVLFQMGVFNSSSLSVRIPPGACKVIRTSAAVNLVGQCSGILPKYVAGFSNQGSAVAVPSVSAFNMLNTLTVSMWFYSAGVITGYAIHPATKASITATFELYYFGTTGDCSGSPCLQFYGNTGGTWEPMSASYVVTPNTWYHVVLSYNSLTGGQLYINGKPSGALSASGTLAINTAPLMIASNDAGTAIPTAYMANFQIYNTSLDASSIATLYQEGIGGAPVSPQYLVGWWPLNGDTKDYSGNNNNGVPTAITYTAQYSN